MSERTIELCFGDIYLQDSSVPNPETKVVIGFSDELGNFSALNIEKDLEGKNVIAVFSHLGGEAPRTVGQIVGKVTFEELIELMKDARRKQTPKEFPESIIEDLRKQQDDCRVFEIKTQ